MAKTPGWETAEPGGLTAADPVFDPGVRAVAHVEELGRGAAVRCVGGEHLVAAPSRSPPSVSRAGIQSVTAVIAARTGSVIATPSENRARSPRMWVRTSSDHGSGRPTHRDLW
jgi:hypothetical protein